MNTHYQWVAFDADETLFAFHSFLGLSKIMADEGVPFCRDDYQTFQAVNAPLWQAYQSGTVSARELGERRFAELAKQTRFSPWELNIRLQEEMASLSPPLAGVAELLAALQGRVRVAIITNGFAAVQQPRLRHTGLADYIDVLVVSEEVGVAKPDVRIFQHALAQMGNPNPERVLMVGDSLVSDIAGAQAAQMRTCWFNPMRRTNDSPIRPDFEIAQMADVLNVLQHTQKG